METRQAIINGKTFLFINRYANSRSGFNHISTLMCDGMEVGEATQHYINRTWEPYTYRSVMYRVVYEMIQDRLNRYIARYKRDNNIERFPRGMKAKLEEEFYKQEPIKELKELEATLN